MSDGEVGIRGVCRVAPFGEVVSVVAQIGVVIHGGHVGRITHLDAAVHSERPEIRKLLLQLLQRKGRGKTSTETLLLRSPKNKYRNSTFA